MGRMKVNFNYKIMKPFFNTENIILNKEKQMLNKGMHVSGSLVSRLFENQLGFKIKQAISYF